MYHLNETGVILQYMLYYYLIDVKFMEVGHQRQKPKEETAIFPKRWLKQIIPMRNLGLPHHPLVQYQHFDLLH